MYRCIALQIEPTSKYTCMHLLCNCAILFKQHIINQYEIDMVESVLSQLLIIKESAGSWFTKFW